MAHMPQRERKDEATARSIVESCLGVTLVFADVRGGVDYLFETPDGRSAAMEVTTVTDRVAKSNMASWVQARRNLLAPSLQHSWHVSVDGDLVTYKTLVAAVEPLLAEVEAAGISGFTGPIELLSLLPDVSTALQDLSVVAAKAIDVKPGEPARIYPAPVGSEVAMGSNEALLGIERELAGKPDNALKLREARVDERHVFVWLDGDTPAMIKSPLEFHPSNPDEPSDLPDGDPAIDNSIDVLWIVHSLTGLGWQWTRGRGWRHVVDHTLI